jgi:uncharacterized protein
MKISYSALLSVAAVASAAACLVAVSAAQTSNAGDARASEIIRDLKLSVLPKESGYLGLVGSSAITTDVAGKKIAVQSQVYYMLTRERPINYLHWLAGDDTHILIEGGPVDYFIFHPDGHTEKITLGRNYAAGERPLVAVPGGCWKALRLHDGASYALMANVLSPEFTPDRVKIGADEDWISKYTGSSPWATRETLRAFIGPNWTGK